MCESIPYDSFRYLHSPNYPHNPMDVLDNTYKNLEMLKNKFIVYTKGRGYRVYGELNSFMDHFEKIPDNVRLFHEVIMNGPQKLKFDIDAPLDVDNYQETLNSIIEGISTTFFIVYQKELQSNDMIICESKDITQPIKKYSNHIIIDNYFVTGHEQAAEFTRQLRKYVPDCHGKYIDMSVNKSIQNFRLVGCHKNEDNRIKRIISDHEPIRSIINNVTGCEELPHLDLEVAPRIDCENSELHPDDIDKVLEICRANGIMHHNMHKCTRGSLFIFNRIRPSFCELCSREHTNDHSVLVSAHSADGVITVFKKCRRYTYEHGADGNHYAIIGEFPSEMAPLTGDNIEKKISGWSDRKIARDIANLKMDTDGVSNLFPRAVTQLLFAGLSASSKHIYAEPTLRPFELSKTLIVHAAMKMGKTKALADYIGKYFDDKLRESVIRIVSFRQTFSGNLKEKFANFALYNDSKGVLNQSKLIIQVESLHRLDVREGIPPPDLLILDECESIFEQFDSGLLKGNFSDCFAKFQYMMRFSRHVVCMDANISNRTYRLLAQMRPGFGTTDGEITYHHNHFKNATQDKYYITGDKLKWMGMLYSMVESDERIAVPISSLDEAKAIFTNLTKKYPNKRIKLYSSETSMSEKKEHFADVNTYWAQYDVLIYTPTVSAGVSFEQKHFKHVFGYFSDQSCPVETCIQMIGRIRDVAEHNFYIYLAGRGNTLPVTIDAIKNQVMTRRDNLSRNFDATGLRVEYGENGERHFHGGDYFQMWLENTRIKNISKNSFIKLFLHIVAGTGAQLTAMTDKLFEECTGMPIFVDGHLNDDLQKVRDEHAVVRAEVKAISCKRIADARDIDDNEMESIRMDIVAQNDIAIEQRAEVDKYYLRRCYNYYHEMDEKFVAKYDDKRTRRIYRNMSRLNSYGDEATALKRIQEEECANHKYLMEMDDQAGDLNRKYVFDQHRYAIGLLKLCGWTKINDVQYIHSVLLANTLRNAEKLYWDSIRSACAEFGIKLPRLQNITANRNNDVLLIANMIAPINKILGVMYGIGIRTEKNDPGMYHLSQCNLFTDDSIASKNRHMPMISGSEKAVTVNI